MKPRPHCFYKSDSCNGIVRNRDNQRDLPLCDLHNDVFDAIDLKLHQKENKKDKDFNEIKRLIRESNVPKKIKDMGAVEALRDF